MKVGRVVGRCCLFLIFMKVQYIPRWKRRLKEVLWRLLLRLRGVRKEDFANAQSYTLGCTDPKDELLDHMEEKKRLNETFTPMHLIVHMEGIRLTVPLDDYEEHREWVFNQFPHLIPSFANLLGNITGLLLRKIIVVAFTRGVAAL